MCIGRQNALRTTGQSRGELDPGLHPIHRHWLYARNNNVKVLTETALPVVLKGRWLRTLRRHLHWHEPSARSIFADPHAWTA